MQELQYLPDVDPKICKAAYHALHDVLVVAWVDLPDNQESYLEWRKKIHELITHVMDVQKTLGELEDARK